MPMLRPRQEEFAGKALSALDEHGNTLGVAATGAGKTYILSAIGNRIPGKHLVLQHRNKLVEQNKATYELWNGRNTSIVAGDTKDYSGKAIFAMVQTLSRDANLAKLNEPIDLLVIDEGHHSAADTYTKVIDHVYKINPKAKLLVLTATPMRGDGKGLGRIVTNVADVITTEELIISGNLVQPRTFVIDLGCQKELLDVPILGVDYDMDKAAAIFNTDPHNQRIIETWQEHAGDRQTIFFASNVQHAKDVCQAFQDEGIKAGVIYGDQKASEQDAILEAYDKFELQVLFNVFVLTEGYDNQPTSCVALLRLSSEHGTLMQMAGRGLRTVDPERYPGITKEDCVILDYGTSFINHQTLDQAVLLADQCGQGMGNGEAPTKICPNCEAENPAGVKVCSLCGNDFTKTEEVSTSSSSFTMREVKLVKKSPYKWQPLNPFVLMANSFSGWCMVIFHNDKWHAIGATMDNKEPRYLAKGKRIEALSTANDFMCQFGNAADSGKRKTWLNKEATEKQLKALGDPLNFGMKRYEAACKLTFRFNKAAVAKIIN